MKRDADQVFEKYCKLLYKISIIMTVRMAWIINACDLDQMFLTFDMEGEGAEFTQAIVEEGIADIRQ